MRMFGVVEEEGKLKNVEGNGRERVRERKG